MVPQINSRRDSIARSVTNLAAGEAALSRSLDSDNVIPFPEVEWYPLAAPCEYCGDPVWDHSPSELASCVLDLDMRRHEAEALEWWKSQQ